MIRVRNSSRRQHPSRIETVFPGPLQLIRQFAGPFALQKCFEQMEASMFYRTSVLQRPEGMRDWEEYALRVSEDVGYSWEHGEELHMINDFRNDNSHISTIFLLRLIRGRGLTVEHLVRVTHIGTDALHIVVLLREGGYVCDCCMGMNLGLPCRHYFQVLSTIPTLRFNLGMIRARWYQDKDLDIRNIPAVEAREAQFRRPEANLPVSQQTPIITSNPLERQPSTPAPSQTQTVPARTVYHEAAAALGPLMNGIQTREELTDLLEEHLCIVPHAGVPQRTTTSASRQSITRRDDHVKSA